MKKLKKLTLVEGTRVLSKPEMKHLQGGETFYYCHCLGIPVHEGCGNVVTLKEQKEDLHKDCPKITQRLPKGCTKHIGINHAEPKHNNQTIE